MLGSLARFSLLGVDQPRLKPFTKCERSLNAMLTVYIDFTHIDLQLLRRSNLLAKCYLTALLLITGLYLQQVQFALVVLLAYNRYTSIVYITQYKAVRLRIMPHSNQVLIADVG